MNVVGILFGVSLALALIGGVGIAFAVTTRASVYALATAMLGVAGVCLALGNDFVAIVVLVMMVLTVPAVLLLTLDLAPPPQPDRSSSGGAAITTGMVIGGAALAWLLVRTVWLPAGGARENTIEWIGSRFLSDHLILLDLLAGFLALSSIAAIALLRGRARSRA